jgi:DNA-binding MarR family transcriptional regulator
MAETLAALRTGGLISESKDPADGRKTLIHATARGRTLTATIPAAREAWLEKAMRALLRAEEQETVLRAAEIMNRIADGEV